MDVFNHDIQLPLIAILRGVQPSEILAVTDTLLDEGFEMIEVPLNSPDALQSIQLLVENYGQDILVGAGTVTTPDKAREVIETGANLIVTPNYNQAVIEESVAAGCATFAGVLTPTEAFAALAAGATGLKIFPVHTLGVEGYKAMVSVLPKQTLCFPVGGIDASVASMQPYLALGASGFGLGNALYRPQQSLSQTRSQAHAFVESFHQANVG